MSFVSSKGNILCRLINIELYKIFAIINRTIKDLHCIYIRESNWSPLVYIMVWRLIGAKPLPDEMLFTVSSVLFRKQFSQILMKTHKTLGGSIKWRKLYLTSWVTICNMGILCSGLFTGMWRIRDTRSGSGMTVHGHSVVYWKSIPFEFQGCVYVCAQPMTDVVTK